MNDANEIEKRIQRRIASAAVKHMSNTKWRKLFSALHSIPDALGKVEIKFINDDRLFAVPPPGPDFAHEANFGECGGISYSPFTHIEFVQIPYKCHRELDGSHCSPTEATDNLQKFVARLAQIGSFPIQVYDAGIRIRGYDWNSSDKTKPANQHRL